MGKSGKKNVGYTFNDDMTCAAVERAIMDNNLCRSVLDGSLFHMNELDTFYGTVPNMEVVARAKKLNRFLDVIKVGTSSEVEHFQEPSPRSDCAHLAINLKRGNEQFLKTPLKAFKELVDASDEVSFYIIGDYIRINFCIDGVWKEHRDLSIEEKFLLGDYDWDDNEFDDDYDPAHPHFMRHDPYTLESLYEVEDPDKKNK